ncbi:hypothetical protein MSAN_00761800 [Mycena sanguinolenta]|uniref:O-fucosyltransferase family protein n=1 Tax=Mycena sanguinolenta TaxID=230812 RepID=A0A8H7DEC1_9AGAR|nr:hypothetical protein MSAN_00761800 [Mycena sanguinolenta]
MHSSNPSVLRRANPRVLFAAFFLTCIGYYVGRLSQPEPPQNSASGHVPEPKLEIAEGERVTITVQPPPVTVQGPQVTVQVPATVTLTTEVHVPKEEVVPEEPVVLNGPPTQAFQDNLRPDVNYITVWPGSGFTNDVMSYMNLIYLSLLTQRVPILPFFTPTHVKRASGLPDVPAIDFGEVFDVPRLSKGIGKPIVEWWQVKVRHTYYSSQPSLILFLFPRIVTAHRSIRWDAGTSGKPFQKVTNHPMSPAGRSVLISIYRIRLLRSWIKLFKDSADEPHMRFTSLMALAFPEQRNKNIRTPAPSLRLKASLPPDEHLTCFDNMYWIANVEPHEFQHDYSTAWRFVGKYLHWNPRIEGLAQNYIRKTFGLSVAAEIPPRYITIHVRHNDFAGWCHRPVDECFAPLSAYARRVDEVKAELLQTKNLTVSRVIMTSDEKNSTWWDEVEAYGWHRVDHSTTVATYGGWYPLLIDAAIQSGGMGIVGTDLSTVSMIAGHRVKAWRDGAVRQVKWGHPGADDH